MENIDMDPLTTPELHSDLCNIVERNYQQMPRPGTDGDDGTRPTSDAARAAANDILDAVYRAFGVERQKPDPMEQVRGAFPGRTDEWYVAMLARRKAYAEGKRGSELPELPCEEGRSACSDPQCPVCRRQR
jgi:hypothetical protein